MSAVPAVPEPTSTDVAPYDPDAVTGLEDFDLSTDGVMPRLSIMHKEARFQDSLTKEEFTAIDAILLGFAKGRILWDDDVQDDAVPMCKSYDFTTGYPDLKQFPWESSGFDKSAFENDELVVLPCDGCHLKDWGTHPKRENAPWCGEQHIYPLLMNTGGSEPGDEMWVPCLLTVQRTSLKNSKAYVSAFARTQTPLYTVRTNLSLRPQKRGNVEWAVLEFRKGAPTDSADWPDFSTQFRAIKNFVQTPRIRTEDDAQQPVNNTGQPATTQPPAQPAAAQPAQTATAPASGAQTAAQPAQPTQPPAPAAQPAAAQASDLPF